MHSRFRRDQVDPAKRLTKRSRHGPVIAPSVTPAHAGVDIDLKTIPLNCSNYVINGDCIRSLYGTPEIDVNKKISPVNALGL